MLSNQDFETLKLTSYRLSDINFFLFPLPPLSEQHRILQKLDTLMILCDELETQIKAKESSSVKLLESSIHEALSPALEEAA